MHINNNNGSFSKKIQEITLISSSDQPHCWTCSKTFIVRKISSVHVGVHKGEETIQFLNV